MKLLGSLSPAAFLQRHWHRTPLFVTGALPQADAIVDRAMLFELATSGDVESRLVMRRGRRWHLVHGPFRRRELARLPPRDWTLLVSGLNLHLPAARALLDRFRFVPYARQDDVMASYAVPGGGVGPHFDSYDVFLLQGRGERHWRVSAQRDLALVPDAPLRILKRFRAAQAWTARAGDLLYLPPRYAHDGVARDECITLSVGFRAPSAQELAGRFLEYLGEHLALEGMYADPGLAPARGPGRIPRAMTAQAARMLGRIRWSEADVMRFLGTYLTEPKAHVVFDPPPRPLSRARFAAALARHGARLALKSQMLYGGGEFFLNGERLAARGASAALMRGLADRRALPPVRAPDAAARLLHDAYCAGFLELAHER